MTKRTKSSAVTKMSRMEHGSNVVLKFNHETMVFVVVLAVLASLTYMGSRDKSRRDTLSNADSLSISTPVVAAPKVVSSITNDTTVAPSSSSSAAPASVVVNEPSPVNTGVKFEIGEPTASETATEKNTATDLNQQLKRAKTTVKEAAIGTDLNAELKRAKTVVKEGLRGEYPDALNLNINRKGFGRVQNRVGGLDPMPVIMPIIPRDTFSFSYDSNLVLGTVEVDTRPASVHLYAAGRTYQELARDAEVDTKIRGNFGLLNNVYIPKRRTFTVDPGWDGFDEYQPPSVSKMGAELAMADDSGSTASNFEVGGGGAGGGALTNGLGKEAWDKQGVDWNAVKDKLLVTVKNIMSLFDRLFAEEIFPDAVVDVQPNGQVFIRDGKEGKCIRVERWYEYVQSSVIAQLALGQIGPLPWAKSVELGFDAIEKAKQPLRAGILCDCGKGEGSYVIAASGEVKTAEGKEITVTIPWPKTQSVLLVHPMRIKKGKK